MDIHLGFATKRDALEAARNWVWKRIESVLETVPSKLESPCPSTRHAASLVRLRSAAAERSIHQCRRCSTGPCVPSH